MIRRPPTSLGELLDEALQHNDFMRRIAMAFQVGDVVRLKSGGPAMTVGKLGDGMATCYWAQTVESDGGFHDFPVEALLLVPTPSVTEESMKAAREYLEKEPERTGRKSQRPYVPFWDDVRDASSPAMANAVEAMIAAMLKRA